MLLTWDKFKSGLYLEQPEFTYSAYVLFTEHCERIYRNS